MNKTYRLIWSDIRQTWVVTSELAATRGKPSRVKPAVALLAGALASIGVHAQVPAPNALPTGGQVVGGQASIATSGATMNIQQSSQRAIVNWQSFNIGSGAAVNFQQPNAGAVALNRVVGSDPSAIYGSLTANGQVFLLNPSGVVFGPGARVDVGGLVASTLGMRNDDFLSGNYRFTRDGFAGSVLNQGDLFGQYVALLAPEVRNEGVIMARQGTAALAGGDAVTLNIAGSNLVGVQVDRASINTLVENRRLVQADGGLVILSAQSAHDLVGKVVNTGVVQAGGISTDGGVVRLVASSAIELGGTVNVDAGANGKGGTVLAIADLANPGSRTDFSGTISAKGGSVAGDGGFVETSASKLGIGDNARVVTTAANGASGQWLLDPYDFTIAASGGDVTGAVLTTALGSGNVTIQTAAGSAGCTGAACGTGNASGNGDIFVNDNINWSANTLTLQAHRDVNVNATLGATGTAGLAVEYGQGAAASGNDALFTVNGRVDLASTAAFSTKLGNDGSVLSYTIINDLAGLTGIDLNSTTVQGNYALGSNITITSGTWTPIGNAVGPFQGVFEGLGHTVSGIANDAGVTANVGFFGDTAGSARVQNFGVTNVNLTGRTAVGAVVGNNSGTLYNTHSSGTIGLDGAVTGSDGVFGIGGLVGMTSGNVERSHSSVNVTAVSGNQDLPDDPFNPGFPASSGLGQAGGIGGLVGIAQGGTVKNSYASGSVSGTTDVGGLIGHAAAPVENSYSRGAVSGVNNPGGLIGALPMGITVTGSFWDTETSGQAVSGGTETGLTTAQMQTAANFNSATAANGFSNPAWDTTRHWKLADGSYPVFISAVAASGPSAIGITLGDFTRTYGTAPDAGNLTGFSFTGTLQGSDSLSGIRWGSAYTQTLGVGEYRYQTTADLLAPQFTFADGRTIADYSITYSDNKLVIDKANLTLSGTRVYDGSTTVAGSVLAAIGVNGEIFSVTGSGDASNLASKNASLTPQTLASLTGLALGSGNSAQAMAGNYNALSATGSAVTISPKAVTLTAPDVSKTYDGGLTYTTVAGDLTALSGQLGVSGDTVTAATIAYTNKNAGAGNKTVTFDAATISDGNGGNNYTITRQGNSTSTINKADLVLSGTRVYDATTVVAGSVLMAAGVNGETFGVTGAGDSSNLASKNANAAPQSLASLTGLALGTSSNGGDAGNYNPITITGSAVTITRKTLDVWTEPSPSQIGGGTPPAGTLVKIYDGTSSASLTTVASMPALALKESATAGTASSGQPYAGDDVSIDISGASGQFRNGSNVATANVTEATTVALSGLALTGAESGNYQLPASPTLAGQIRPKTVTLSATKTYDGTTALSGSQVTITTGVGGETLTYSGATANSRNVADNAGNFISAITLGNGSNGGLAVNYQLPTLNNTNAPVTIDPKSVVLTVANVSKIYDATLGYTTTADNLAALSSQLGGSGDAVTAATIAYTDRNAGAGNRTVTLDAVTINNGNDNYSLTLQGNSTSTITPKALSLLGITGVPSELTKPAGFTGGTVGQQFAIPTSLSGTPMLQTAIAAGTGTATDGKPYDIDGPFTFSGTPQANTWTVTASTATATDVTAPVTGLTLTGTGSANYTVTGTSVSSKIKPSAAVVVPQQQQVVNQVLATQEKPTTTTTRPTTTTTRPTTTTREPQTTTTAPPPAQVSATTSNPTPRPGEAVPITAPATGGQPSLDPSKPVVAVLVPASGDADVPMPTPTITQNADGTISVNVTVPTGTPPGVYIIAVVGTSASGQSKSIIVPVVVRRVVASAE